MSTESGSRRTAQLRDVRRGLSDDEVRASRQEHGSNEFTPLPSSSWWDFVKASFSDPMLRILVVAALVSVGLGARSGEYQDGVAITVAVVVVVLVGTFNELRAQRDYSALNDISAHHQVKVIRNSRVRQVDVTELVVGDVVDLALGDVLPADALFVHGNPLIVNEAEITGEPQTEKNLGEPLYAGSRLLDGSGKAEITSVGDNTVYGRIRSEIRVGGGSTPLQERLEAFARWIGKVGTAVAVLTFAGLVMSDVVRESIKPELSVDFFGLMLDHLTIAVTIVVVSVPEGLPLAVTLSLAYTTRKMAAEMALVRELSACETMGSATIVCTDKTGTLTFGRMDVSWLNIDGCHIEASQYGSLPPETRALLGRAFSVNSTADLIDDQGEIVAVGNPTEGALLRLLDSTDEDYSGIRRTFEPIERVEFNSVRKYMSTRISVNGGDEVHLKGAPEVVLEMCNSDGHPVSGELTAAAGRGYRTLGLACGSSIEDLRFLGLVVLDDTLRPEVPESVQRCRRAGVEVMMITGDNADTAHQIATEAGIADGEGQLLSGPESRELTDDELSARLSRTKVIARALPDDKSRVARLLQERGEVVAMTGDGVNDAPALVAADVGFAMGSGSKVAREAGDIVVVDDDFTTIVRAIRWGRSVFENIRKFLQFQLTVNLVALAVAFTAALGGFGTPLTAVQLLWVNLIMDSLAAIALTLQPPSEELYDQPPHGRSDPLVSRFMAVNIGITAAYMFVVLWVVLLVDIFGSHGTGDLYRNTVVFNVFVFMQLFNAFNARAVRPCRNPFKGLGTSPAFTSIMLLILIVQVAVVLFGGAFFDTQPLDPWAWFLSFLVGVSVLPVGALSRTVSRHFAD